MMSGDGSNHKISRLLIHHWQTVTQVPALDADEIHVWLLRIDERLRAILEPGLSPPEMERAAAFRFRNHQNQFVVARGALRFLLGRYLGQPAGDIEILSAELGKPYLSQRFLPNVQFNISHSSEYALLGFSIEQELGIDIERHDPGVIDEGLLRQCLTASEKLRYEQALPEEKTEFFFGTWARKEAYMKLLGDGLNISPNELSLAPMSGHQKINGYDICFTPMPEIEGFSSALTTEKQPAKVRFWTPGSNLL